MYVLSNVRIDCKVGLELDVVMLGGRETISFKVCYNIQAHTVMYTDHGFLLMVIKCRTIGHAPFSTTAL